MDSRLRMLIGGVLVLAWTVWSAIWTPDDTVHVLAVILGNV